MVDDPHADGRETRDGPDTPGRSGEAWMTGRSRHRLVDAPPFRASGRGCRFGRSHSAPFAQNRVTNAPLAGRVGQGQAKGLPDVPAKPDVGSYRSTSLVARETAAQMRHSDL